MIIDCFKEKLSVVSFIFFGSIVSGLVLIGVCQSFTLMLTEQGMNPTTITNLLLATAPYGFRFAISPFVKNIIEKNQIAKINPIKTVSLISQLSIVVGFASLGLFTRSTNLALVNISIFWLVFSVCVQDVVRDHLKLTEFDPKQFGLISAIENTSFRLGMFIAGSCLVYIANFKGWKFAFASTSLVVLFSTISTLFIKTQTYKRKEKLPSSTREALKSYALSTVRFFRQYNVLIIICLILSFRMTDNCISTLKSMFLHHLGITRIEFAKIYILGIVMMISSGFIAGLTLYNWKIKKCIQLTFISQILTTLFFSYLSLFPSNYITIMILASISTFVFGFSGVIFRTFIANESKQDVNIYTILVSIGSLLRIVICSFSGSIVDHFSWVTLYALCLISNIPGFLLYSKLKNLHKN